MLSDQRQAGDVGGTGAKAGPMAGTEALAPLYPDSQRELPPRKHSVSLSMH